MRCAPSHQRGRPNEPALWGAAAISRTRPRGLCPQMRICGHICGLSGCFFLWGEPSWPLAGNRQGHPSVEICPPAFILEPVPRCLNPLPYHFARNSLQCLKFLFCVFRYKNLSLPPQNVIVLILGAFSLMPQCCLSVRLQVTPPLGENLLLFLVF